MLLVILLLVIVLLGFYVLRFYAPKKRRRLLALAAQVPTYKGALPFVGHFHKIIGGGAQFWKRLKEVSLLTEEAGGVMSVWAGPTVHFVVNDPDDAVTVLNSCLKKSIFYRILESFAGQGLLTADVPIWKRNRKLLNPTFSQHVLDGFLDIFNEQSALLAQDLETLAGTGEFDPQEYCANRILGTVCKTTLGLSLDDDKSMIDQTYVKALETAFDMMTLRLSSFWLHPDFIYGFSAVKKQEDEAMATVHNTSRSVVYKRKAEREQAKVANTSQSYTLPAGSGCIISIWGIHRLPIWGPDRFEFRPERWLDPGSLPQSPGAYCTFSIGRRGCIGKAYAVMGLKTMLVHLIRKFRVTADYSKTKCTFDLLVKFVAGHHISMELRK